MYKLREYQERVVDKCIDFINDKKSFSKKLLVSPVGSGKSLIIAAIANALNQELIVLQPSKVLLKQNYEKYLSYGNKASIFSASMGQ
jgi:DNA repair protein RadD